MTDQPGASSGTPPPLAPLVDQQAGWTPAEAQPTPAAPPPGAPAPAPKATRGDKLRMGLILGGIVGFLAIVLVLTANNQSAGDLAVGQCFDVPSRTEDISTVTKHECTEPHDAEVFHVAEYTGADSYPISLGFESFVDSACIPVFATYVGKTFEEAEEYNVGWFYPNRDGWNDGDRTVTCYVVRVDEAKMTQSVKAAT